MGAFCRSCGKSLEGRRADAAYCSSTCRNRARDKRLREGTPHLRVDLGTQPPVAPSDIDIARLLMSAQSIQAGFELASERSEIRFRPLCSRLARGLEDVLRREGL